jgi:transposase
MDENIRLKNLQLDVLSWMRKISFGYVPFQIIESHLGNTMPRSELAKLYWAAFSTSRRLRNRALAILFHLYRINPTVIAQFLFVVPRTPKNYIRQFELRGAERLLWPIRKKVKKAEDPHYKETLLTILHCPPADYGINRTTWTTELLSRVMKSKGLITGHNTVSQIIRKAGYRFRKARVVLTSNDPRYREKLGKITRILSHLGPEDRFFSIDEFGPFSVKKKGGRKLVPYSYYPAVPQWQKSKGFLIITAALELIPIARAMSGGDPSVPAKLSTIAEAIF